MVVAGESGVVGGGRVVTGAGVSSMGHMQEYEDTYMDRSIGTHI